ncbi:uncharacterized protein PV09_09862, partial [Verruconis gallopava]
PDSHSYVFCYPCLRAVADGYAHNHREATADDEYDYGGLNCKGGGTGYREQCDFCWVDNNLGRDPAQCIEPDEGTKYWCICRAMTYCLSILDTYCDGELAFDGDEDEEALAQRAYDKIVEWKYLLIDYIVAHGEELDSIELD